MAHKNTHGISLSIGAGRNKEQYHTGVGESDSKTHPIIGQLVRLHIATDANYGPFNQRHDNPPTQASAHILLQIGPWYSDARDIILNEKTTEGSLSLLGIAISASLTNLD